MTGGLAKLNSSGTTGPTKTAQSANAGRRETRRIEPRQSVDTGAVIRLIDLAANLEGRILNLSMGGCRIRTHRPFPVGIFRRVETEFRIDGLPFRLAGVTQAMHDRYSVGIRFLDVSDRKREQLAQLIGEIKALREQENAALVENAAAEEGVAAESTGSQRSED